MSKKAPNVLLFFTDQQRFDTIHALGNPVIRTPNLDRLCREGTAFTAAYSPSPVCVPARCSYHYGTYPDTTGCADNNNPMPTSPEFPSFMDVLSRHGYRTHGIGKCHFTPRPDDLRGFQSRDIQEEIKPIETHHYHQELHAKGFTHIQEPHGIRSEMYYIPQISQLPAEMHPTQWVGDKAVEFIRTEHEKPWLLFTSFIHPHPPFAPPSPWHKLYRAAQMPPPKLPPHAEDLQLYINKHQNRYKYRDNGWDLNLVRTMKAFYYACISFIDFQIGRILKALEETGQLDNTIIIFTSDHGEHLGDYRCFGKRSMHDSAARIPMLVRYPRQFPAGHKVNTPVSLVDIYPTILEATGVNERPPHLDGMPLQEIVSSGLSARTVYSQFQSGPQAVYMLRSEHYKYIYSTPDNREILFHLDIDPEETHDLAGVPQYRRKLEEYRAMLMERTGLEIPARNHTPPKTPANPDDGLLVQDPPGFRMDGVPPEYLIGI